MPAKYYQVNNAVHRMVIGSVFAEMGNRDWRGSIICRRPYLGKICIVFKKRGFLTWYGVLGPHTIPINKLH